MSRRWYCESGRVGNRHLQKTHSDVGLFLCLLLQGKDLKDLRDFKVIRVFSVVSVLKVLRDLKDLNSLKECGIYLRLSMPGI